MSRVRLNLGPVSRAHVVRENAARSPVPDLGHTYVLSPKTGQVFKASASQLAQARAAASHGKRSGQARHVRGVSGR